MRFYIPKPKIITLICVLIAVSSLGWCIYRDIQIEKLYPGDLRNRITGSRLQMAGISPYFYHSKPGDSQWFYDPQNYYNRIHSNVTCTPFFHQIISPIALLPQRTISRLWLFIDYVIILLISFMALRRKASIKQKWAVAIIVLFFLYTYAWTENVYCGQMYLFISLLGFLHFYILSRKPTILNGMLAGIVAISLVLIRPPAALCLLPLVFLIKTYPRKFIWAYFISVACILLIAFGSQQSRQYWSDYGKIVYIFSHGDKRKFKHEVPVQPVNLEGWNIDEVMDHARQFSYKSNGENGNLKVFPFYFFKYRATPKVLSIALLVTIGTLFWIIYRKRIKLQKPTLFWLTLTGFCFYMVAEFYSPVYRHTYNSVQWIFPLILLASYYSSGYRKIFIIGILTGLFLNAPFIHFIQMQATLGEYLICASIFGIIITTKKVESDNIQPKVQISEVQE